MQGAHRRHEADRPSGAAIRVERRTQLGLGAQHPGHRRSSGAGELGRARRERLVDGQQLRRQLPDRLGVTRDGLPIAARDRAGEGIGAALSPVRRGSQHQWRQELAGVRDAGLGEQAGRRLLEGDEEVRRHRGRRVVCGPPLLGDGERSHLERLGELARQTLRARVSAGDRTRRAGELGRAVGDRLQRVNGEGRRAAIRARGQGLQAGGAAGVADEAKRRNGLGDRPGGGRDLGVGHAQQCGLARAARRKRVFASGQPNLQAGRRAGSVHRVADPAGADHRKRRHGRLAPAPGARCWSGDPVPVPSSRYQTACCQIGMKCRPRPAVHALTGSRREPKFTRGYAPATRVPSRRADLRVPLLRLRGASSRRWSQPVRPRSSAEPAGRRRRSASTRPRRLRCAWRRPAGSFAGGSAPTRGSGRTPSPASRRVGGEREGGAEADDRDDARAPRKR